MVRKWQLIFFYFCQSFGKYSSEPVMKILEEFSPRARAQAQHHALFRRTIWRRARPRPPGVKPLPVGRDPAAGGGPLFKNETPFPKWGTPLFKNAPPLAFGGAPLFAGGDALLKRGAPLFKKSCAPCRRRCAPFKSDAPLFAGGAPHFKRAAPLFIRGAPHSKRAAPLFKRGGAPGV